MPRNKRVAKEVIKYSLRLEPEAYSNIQKNAEYKGMTMNALLNKIIEDFIKDEEPTPIDQLTLEQIKSLPLKEQKAILKELSTND